jgi:DNA-binding CsgD family transcriptional regulator
MVHIRIFVYIITLIIGTWSGYYLVQKYRIHRYTFLPHLIGFIVLFNVTILITLLVKYVSINLNAGTPPEAPLLNGILNMITFVLTLGMAWRLIRVQRELLRWRTTRRWVRATLSAAACLFIGYGFIVALYLANPSSPTLVILYYNLILLPVLVLFGSFIHLLICTRRIAEAEHRRVTQSFGVFYFVAFILLMACLMAPESVQFFSEPPVVFLFNLFPVLWFRFGVLKNGSMLPRSVDKTGLECYLDKYDISPREREIIQLVLEGRGDREIANTLFIAYHTVKNHKYQLYKKLGVKSRFELMTMVLDKK